MPIMVTIADDSRMSRKAVMRALPTEWDISITEAENGLQALECYQKGLADVLFLDLTMPEMDGFQVLETLKSQTARNFVFVISADIQPYSQQRVSSLGAVCFLKKPLDKDLLEMELRKVGLL